MLYSTRNANLLTLNRLSSLRRIVMQTPEVGPVWPPIRNRIIYNSTDIRSGWRLLTWLGLSLIGVVAAAIGLVVISISSSWRTRPGAIPTWLLMGFDWLLFVPAYLSAVF